MHPPLYTLTAGERFVTRFGIVEVVNDLRDTPTAKRPENIKKLIRTYNAAKAKYDGYKRRMFVSLATILWARRTRINMMYEKGRPVKYDIFKAYFGGDPRYVTPGTGFPPSTNRGPADPTTPPTSFPDRIVECVLIADKRQRFVGSDTKTPVNSLQEDCPTNHTTTRLYLQRRLLTEPYNEKLPTYECAFCGTRFLSQTGQKYHVMSAVCKQKSKASHDQRREMYETINKGVKKLLMGDKAPIMPTPPRLGQARPVRKKDERKRRRRKKKESSMYPEVLLSLGFKLVKKNLKITDSLRLPDPVPAKTAEGDGGEDNVDTSNLQCDLTVDPPDMILVHLKNQLIQQQRGADDQKYGSMYSEVYKSLGFRKTTAKRRRCSDKDRNDFGTAKRRRRAKKIQPPPPPKPLPPIIDTRALADEVDSGRYPSMKRYTGEKHDDTCFLCKDGGDLICCDFCPKAEHMACILKKFTVKEPEPEDDFMCHRCIQVVMQRRNRAEKRRLEKRDRDERKQQEKALENEKRNPGMRQGMEYEYMAERGQEVSELVEMLQDAQNRLKQCIETAKMNNVRRRMMGCYFNEK